jgi:hypothetical protein
VGRRVPAPPLVLGLVKWISSYLALARARWIASRTMGRSTPPKVQMKYNSLASNSPSKGPFHPCGAFRRLVVQVLQSADEPRERILDEVLGQGSITRQQEGEPDAFRCVVDIEVA